MQISISHSRRFSVSLGHYLEIQSLNGPLDGSLITPPLTNADVSFRDDNAYDNESIELKLVE